HDHGHTHDHDHDHDHSHTHGHLHGIETFALTFDTPIDGRKLTFALELLRSTHGEKLLRIKGIIRVEGEPAPFIIHGVQHVFYPPVTLNDADALPEGESRIVFITRGLSRADVTTVLDPLFKTTASKKLDPSVRPTTQPKTQPA
ncbi:MAG: GTP-binding protein, partial [Pseudomonadota bacterium]